MKKNIIAEIERLINQYKLTINEVCAHLVEWNDILETEEEIRKIIFWQIKDKKIEIIYENGNEFIKSVISQNQNWHKIDRANSVRWFYENTTLDDFYVKLRSIYCNLIKTLKNNNVNNYNLVYDADKEPLEVLLFDKKGVNFSSNDYLGLAKDSRVINAAVKGIKKYGNSTGGARIMIGTTPLHKLIEEKIAKFKGTEDAILFSCGYMTNLALLSMLSPETVVFIDRLDHASIVDGLKMSGASSVPFKHNNVDDLERKLKKHKDSKQKLIFIEGIYSMDGDIAKVPQIVELAKKYNSKLAVDEAHSTGVLGIKGRGVAEYFNLSQGAIDLKMGTLSKAIGAQGGFIAGKKLVIDAFRYFARQFLFSTSLPAGVLAGAMESFNIIENDQNLVTSLSKKANQVRSALLEIGFDIGESQTQIIPIIIKDEVKTHQLQALLRNDGVFVMAVTYPGVAKKQARLRLSISTAHTDEHVSNLINSLKKRAKELALI